jgi:hypothetical protein
VRARDPQGAQRRGEPGLHRLRQPAGHRRGDRGRGRRVTDTPTLGAIAAIYREGAVFGVATAEPHGATRWRF